MPYMTADALVERMKGIPEFILSKIAEILDCYDKETTVAEGFLFERCPKCGAIHPRITKGGKQMFRCMDCRRRLTADCGTCSFYSHQRDPKPGNNLACPGRKHRHSIQDEAQAPVLAGGRGGLGQNLGPGGAG